MIKTLSNDNMFNYFYKPGKKEVIVTGKIDGYWWKGKIDSLVLEQNYFCDLKTVDDHHKGHWNVDEHDTYLLSRIENTTYKWHYIEN